MAKLLRVVLRLCSDVVLLGALAVVLVALWGLREVDTQEDVPASVRVINGKAAVMDGGGQVLVRGGGLLSLQPGQRLKAEREAEVFLHYPDGSVSRLSPTAEVLLQESQRSIKKPAILAGVLARLSSSPPPSPAEVRLSVEARVLKGEVATKAAAPAPGSSFRLFGPGMVVLAQNASYALTVPEAGDVSLEVGQGPIGAAFVSAQGGSLVPVVVPELASRTGVSIPLPPPSAADLPTTQALVAKLAAAAPELRRASGEVSVEGIAFREVTSGAVRHFVSDSAGGPQASTAASQSVQPESAAGQVEQAVKPPGVQEFRLNDADLLRALPASLASQVSAHILPGGVLRLEYRGATFLASFHIEDGRAVVQGLPFGFNPQQMEDAVKQQLGRSGAPSLLSIASQEGIATITYETEATPAPAEAQETIEPPSLPHMADYFKSIPNPREISTDWKVVGSNVLLATVITVLIRVFTGFAANFVRQQEERVLQLYAPLLRIGKSLVGPFAAVGSVLRWFAPGPIATFALMMFLFGAIYSFLSKGQDVLAPSGLVVFVTLSLTSGFMALYDMRVRALVAKRLKIAAKDGLYYGQTGIAVVTVGISRVFSLSPGLMLGTMAGVKLPKEGVTARHKFILNMVSLASIAFLGALAWAGVYLLVQASAQPWAQGVFRVARGVSSGVQDWGLAIFAMAVQRAFFPLLPLPGNAGQDLLRRRWWVWGAVFALALFVFLHTQLNQKKNVTELTPQTYLTLGIAVALGGLAQLYTMRQSRKKKGGEQEAAGAERTAPAAR
ncbi:MAG: hypothetical protein HY681_11655 [Chloroflexi bacterium]|nr:hypothetical protein [Chloroflexota bacterium]